MSDGDVITSFSARDEALRATLGGKPPRNFGEGQLAYFNHMSALEIQNRLGPSWDTYFKFCFERNPWDKVVSLYFHRHKTEPRITFDEFLYSGEALDARNIGLYTINGAVAVDFIGRFESLLEDLTAVCRKLEIAPPHDLARAKTQFRPPGTRYREFLTPAQSDYISLAFRDEIELHGYSF
jgi:hypothetical protein